jgi:hypothetical protein
MLGLFLIGVKDHVEIRYVQYTQYFSDCYTETGTKIRVAPGAQRHTAIDYQCMPG